MEKIESQSKLIVAVAALGCIIMMSSCAIVHDSKAQENDTTVVEQDIASENES